MEPPSIYQAPPSNQHARRSAGSTWCCIVETVLSTIVFVYAMIRAMEEKQMGLWDIPCNFVGFSVALGAACGMWTGASLCFTFSVQKAVSNIISIHERETRRGREDSPGFDGVNLFEYHDVVAIGLNVTAVFSLCLLCLFWWFGVCFFFVLTVMLGPFNIFSPGFPPVFIVFFILWLGCYLWLIYKWGIVGRFRNLRETCRTRPSCAHAQTLVLASSALYAAFLCLPPIPWVWRLSLMTTHTARAIKVWKSLDGQGGVVEARGEFDML